jgi:hypothetical protein
MAGRTVGCAACLAALSWLLVAVDGPAAEADRRSDVCKPGITDDRATPLPAWLASRARQVFGLEMPDDLIQKTTVYRCVDGKALFCTTGANLACGKANVSRDVSGVAAWCRDHSQSDSVPMFVTGHDTIYRWHCFAGRPQVDATVETVDARGFIARNWRDAGHE